jgi:hypothetical protein
VQDVWTRLFGFDNFAGSDNARIPTHRDVQVPRRPWMAASGHPFHHINKPLQRFSEGAIPSR